MVGIVGNRMKEREPANNVSSCLQCVRHKTTVLVVGNGGRSARFLVRIVFALYLFLLAIGKLRITTTDPTMSTMERSLESFQRLRRQQQQQDQHLQHTNLVPSSSSSSSTSTTFGGRNANDEWIPRQDEVEPDYYDMDDGHDESSMGCSSVSSGLPRLVRERDYTRVPGYVRGCDISFYGYVMRDLAGRFLSTPNRRPSSSSNVLIVSSSSSISRRETTVQRWASNSTITKEEMIREIAFDIGGSFFIEATLAGYRVISVNNDDDDVVADHIDPAVATDRKLRTIDDDDNDETILLAVFDPDLAQQDDAVRRASRYIRLGSIEYAIFRMVSKATAGDDNNIVSYGLSACETFLSAGYRLQVFSSSHVSRGGHNDYGPNTMFKSVQHVENFLRHGARLAAEVQRDDDRRVGLDATFQSFLFATRGLELAIPSRKEFLNLTGFGDDDVIDVTGSEGVPYLKCPPSEASIRFNEESADDLEISCFGTKVPMLLHVGERKYDDAVVVWHSQPTIRSSEAACVRCKRTSGRNQSLDIDPTDHVACTTRVLEGEASPLAISHERHRRGKNIKPNLLLLELKGVNQHMLNLSLPALHNISESAGLVFFPNYVGMKKNHHVRSVSNFNMSHDLTEQGYRVFQASNQCTGQRTHYHGTDGDSTLSLHGSQLQRMFCFDYNRPNCLGNQHTASYIFQHTTQFIDARRQHDEPWAALLTLVDGQEETETVIGTVDASLLRSFVRRLRRSLRGATWLNTIVAVYSDDNLMPVLYLKASRYESTIRNNREMFVSALDLRRTLHYLTQSTIGAALEGELLTELLPPNRSTCDYLRKTIDATCDDADRELAYADVAQHSPPSILSFYADIPRTQKLNLGINRIKHMPERAEVTEGCLCSTNVRPWFPCDVHPWEEVSNFREYFILVDCPKRPTHLEIRLLPNEVLIKRSNQKRQDSGTTGLPKVNILFLEIDSASVEYADRHFPNTRELLKKYRIHPNGQGMYDCADGLCSADLSFMSLVGANSIPNQVAALSGCVSSSTRRLCGLDPTSSDSIGQVCNDPNEQHYGLRLERVRIAGEHAYWCPVRSVEELKTPWLFGVTDSKGYINYFGEEFCYDNSPYVTQGNVFTKHYQDIEAHHVFCRLAERQMLKQNLTVLNHVLWGMVNQSEPCLDGFICGKTTEKATIALQMIEHMWDTYPDIPKFAFLNAMAAHVYNHNWEKLPITAEAYDLHLFRFLESMLSRDDSNSTLIIVRSDHGLQRGPMAMDYTQQVEHRHPWTEIVIPESMITSKSALFQNQRRLSTGFDLYATLRSVADPMSVISRAGVPDWSFNLLASVIPINRTCTEAMVDPELCRRSRPSREYGVCNVLDPKQVHFCVKDKR